MRILQIIWLYVVIDCASSDGTALAELTEAQSWSSSSNPVASSRMVVSSDYIITSAYNETIQVMFIYISWCECIVRVTHLTHIRQIPDPVQ